MTRRAAILGVLGFNVVALIATAPTRPDVRFDAVDGYLHLEPGAPFVMWLTVEADMPEPLSGGVTWDLFGIGSSKDLGYRVHLLDGPHDLVTESNLWGEFPALEGNEDGTYRIFGTVTLQIPPDRSTMYLAFVGDDGVKIDADGTVTAYVEYYDDHLAPWVFEIRAIQFP